MFGTGPALAALAPLGTASPAGTPGAGAATAACEYDPFGNALGATGHAASRNPFRFSTTFQDPVTRHSYYGYRFYDPANGRWLNRDPIAEAGGLNLYGFVGNDPVNAVDVLGMSTASVAVPWSFMEAGASQSGGAAWLSRAAAPLASGAAIPIAVGGAAAVAIEIAGFNAVHEHMALQVCKRNSCFQATQLFVVGMRAISSILSTQALIAEQQNRPDEGSALNQLSVALDIMDRALSFLREHCPDEFAQYQALKEQANVAAQKAEGGRLLSSAQGAASGGAGAARSSADDIALGLTRGRNKEELLQPWADEIGALTNRDWTPNGLSESAPFVQRFYQALYRTSSRGGRVKFNLDELDLDRALSTRRFSDPFADGVGVTNWELQQVLHNRQFYDATDFFIGGQKLSADDVIEFGLSFRGR